MISKYENSEMLNIVICVYTPYWKGQNAALCCLNKTVLCSAFHSCPTNNSKEYHSVTLSFARSMQITLQ